jgi:hypothetical protein
MKLLLGGLLATALAAPTRVDACPEAITFGDLNLGGTNESISTPIVIAGAGMSTDGLAGTVSVGWAWGKKQSGGLFPGSSLQRVMLGYRAPFDGRDTGAAIARSMDGVTATSDRPAQLALTYGWFDNAILDFGLDVGVAGSSERLGPTAAFTIGGRGIDLRFTGGVQFGDSARFAGAAELVVDVMAFARRY